MVKLLESYPLVMTNGLPWEITHGNRWFTELKHGGFSMANC